MFFYYDYDYAYGLIPLFDFNNEHNIPTIYSSFALLLCSILLAFIALVHKRSNSSYVPWVVMSIIFLYISVDEAALIHELLNTPLRETLKTSGLFFYAWVIPYGIAFMVFVIAYFKFLMRLPKRIRNLFIISGATFVVGAIGFELLGGRQADLYGPVNLAYHIYYTCEEFLEMLGIAIFLYALLLYIDSQFDPITISLNEKE